MIELSKWAVEVRSDSVVVGCDPEMADMGNPRGEIIRERFYMRASNDHGDAFVWGSFKTPEEVEEAYTLLAPPVELWEPSYPVYGSQAYVDYGEADLLIQEKRWEEDDWWAGRRSTIGLSRRASA